MNILALDLGRLLGFARHAGGATLEYGEQDFTQAYEQGYGSLIWAFEKWLPNAMERGDDGPQVIAFEQVHHRGGAPTRIAYGQWAILMKLAHIWPAQVLSAHSATLKKFATGNGRADKAQMITAAEMRLPVPTPLTDNAADALWVYWWALEELKKPRHTEEEIDKLVEMVKKA